MQTSHARQMTVRRLPMATQSPTRWTCLLSLPPTGVGMKPMPLTTLSHATKVLSPVLTFLTVTAGVRDLGDGGLEIGRDLVVLHRVAQEGGVGKAGGLCRNQVVCVLDDDGVLALQHEVIRRLAGRLAAADEQDLVADFLLVLEQLGERERLLKAGDGRHGARDGAAGDDDLVKAARGCSRP